MATRSSTRRSKSSVKPKRSSGSREGNSGLGRVDEVLKRQEEKRAAGRVGWVRFNDDEDEPITVRVYDTTLFRDGYIHQVEFKGKRGTFNRDVMCLDQKEEGEPCPGCADELERRYKFWMPVIQRDAPILNDKKKVIGYKDQVLLLSSSSSRLSKALNRVQKKYGLGGQDIEVTRTGSGFDTQYEVERLEKEPLSAEDKDLVKAFDAEKILGRYTEVKDEDSFYDLDDDDKDDDDDSGEQSKRRGSPFGARSKKSSGSSRRKKDDDDNDDDDDDDGEDDDPRPRARRSSRSKAGTKKPGGLGALKAKSSSKSSSKTTTVRRRSR